MIKNLAKTAVLTCLFVSVGAAAEGVYQVDVTQQNGQLKTGLATKVNNSDFVLDSKLLSSAQQVVIYDNTETPVAKVIAEVVVNDDSSPLGLISASGVGGKAMVLAKESLQPGRKITLVTPSETRPGAIQNVGAVKSVAGSAVYSHYSLYSKGEWGAPLLSNCQELVAISLAESSFITSMKVPEHVAYALETQALKDFLDQQKVAYTTATDVCLSEVELAALAIKKAEEEKIKAEQAATAAATLAAGEAAAAKKALDDATKALKEEQQRLQELKKEAEQIKADKDRAVAKIIQTKTESNEKAEQDEQQKLLLLAVFAAVIVLLLIIFLVMMSRRKKAIAVKEQEALQAQQMAEREKAQAEKVSSENAQLNQALATAKQEVEKSFSDILLHGIDADGNPVKVKINGKALAITGEQSLGREASMVDCVLTSEEVSRQHLKFILQDGELRVRDLGSYNGTYVNRNRLQPNQDTPLPNGSKLALSTIELDVIYA